MNGLERQNELSLRTFVKSRPVAETSAEDNSGKENTMRNPPGTEMRFPHIRRFTIHSDRTFDHCLYYCNTCRNASARVEFGEKKGKGYVLRFQYETDRDCAQRLCG